MIGIIVLLIIALMAVGELYKSIKHGEKFRLFIIFPLFLYIVVGTPIGHHVSSAVNIALRGLGIAWILAYYWYVRRVFKS